MKENRNYSRKAVNMQKAHKFFWHSLYLNSHIHCKKSNRINVLLYKHHIWMIKIAMLEGKWRSVCFTMKLRALHLNTTAVMCWSHSFIINANSLDLILDVEVGKGKQRTGLPKTMYCEMKFKMAPLHAKNLSDLAI